MKQRTGNKFNILLAITGLLLVFLIAFANIGFTGSWLISEDELGFTVKVPDIKIKVEQTISSNVREITKQDNKIYFGETILYSNKEYDLNVTIKNDELGKGFYIRCRALAVVNGTTYNVNNCITNSLYKNTNGWMYLTTSTSSATPIQMPATTTRSILDTITFPSSVFGSLQGKHISLFFEIEGSPLQDFTI